MRVYEHTFAVHRTLSCPQGKGHLALLTLTASHLLEARATNSLTTRLPTDGRGRAAGSYLPASRPEAASATSSCLYLPKRAGVIGGVDIKAEGMERG